MTMEEAIYTLRGLFIPCASDGNKWGCDRNKALDMAIEALSQPIVCKDYRIDDDHIYRSPKMADRVVEALSADAEQGYTEWLEKIIVDNEGANEWLCEDTQDMEWCEKNCHYSSIQAECLRHLYEVSKGGDAE